MPPSYQQREPALTPASTTPALQARRRISSRPCTRHTASRLATEPPITQTTSWPRTVPSTSSTFGIGKR